MSYIILILGIDSYMAYLELSALVYRMEYRILIPYLFSLCAVIQIIPSFVLSERSVIFPGLLSMTWS